jgi:hypothetical protein
MKNKLFLAGIIIILIFGIIGMGCDGGGDSISTGGSGGGGNGGYNGYGGGSGSGGGNGDYDEGSGGSGSSGNDSYDGYDGSGGSGSRDPDYDYGSGIIIVGGSGSGGGRSYYKVKFEVYAEPAGIPVRIDYWYPNNNFNYNSPYPDIHRIDSEVTKFPWEYTISISSKVIGNGVTLSASSDDTTQTLTVRIIIDNKVRASNTGQGSVSVYW